MKRLLVLLLTGIAFALATYANAGFAGRFDAYFNWIYPAHLHCLIFSAIFMVIYGGLFYVLRKKITPKLERFTQYLRQSPSLSIVVWGVLLAIPLGISANVLYLIMFVFGSILSALLLVSFPILLSLKDFRNGSLLNASFMKWNIIFAMSAISASVLFIILTNCGWLKMQMDYHNVMVAIHYKHPYDSMMDIWADALVFLFGSLFGVVFYWIGQGLSAFFDYLQNIPSVKKICSKVKNRLPQGNKPSETFTEFVDAQVTKFSNIRVVKVLFSKIFIVSRFLMKITLLDKFCALLKRIFDFINYLSIQLMKWCDRKVNNQV